jgi:hypothetical protein
MTSKTSSSSNVNPAAERQLASDTAVLVGLSVAPWSS